MSQTAQWYWDLLKNKAVRADERGPGDQVMGPYPTKAAAESWREQVERRNEAWDDADTEWEESWGDADRS